MYVTEYIIDFSFLLLSILLYEYTIIFIHSIKTAIMIPAGLMTAFQNKNNNKKNYYINCRNFKRYSDYNTKTEDKYTLEWRKYCNWCFHTIILPFPLEYAPLLAKNPALRVQL